MKLNELNEASMGSALLTQLGKKITGSGEGQMTLKDRMKQKQFVQDLVGRASVNLAQGIQGGLIDPNPKSSATPAPSQGAKSGQPTPAATSPTAPASPAATAGTTASTPATPAVPKTPEQTRIEKQKTAASAAQSQMAANPATQTGGKANPSGAQAAPAKMTPQQTAALKGRLKGKAGATSAPSGFKNYVGGSGERMTGVDKTGAPVFKKIQRENKFTKLNYVFENIMSLDEQGQYQYTISSYLKNFLKQYMKGVDTSSLNNLADAVQATYSKDKGKQALQNLASSAFALYWTGGAGTAGQEQSAAPTTIGGALSAGLKQGLGQTATTDATTPSTSGATTEPSDVSKQTTDTIKASPEKVQSVYKQTKELLQKLNKQQKGYILKNLEKELGTGTPTQTGPTSSAGEKAFSQMARQLPGKQTSSTGGEITPSATGVTHTAGRGTKIKQKKAASTSTPTMTTKSTRKKASPLPVAESKVYKVWGQK